MRQYPNQGFMNKVAERHQHGVLWLELVSIARWNGGLYWEVNRMIILMGFPKSWRLTPYVGLAL